MIRLFEGNSLGSLSEVAQESRIPRRLSWPRSLFLQTTVWSELNEALLTIHAKKSDLLLVLDHPEIPLHNNLSENDIRQYVKKRKIRRRNA